MNFKKLIPTGFAVAAGLMMTVSAAKADTTAIYTTTVASNPQIVVTIDDFSNTPKYTINISSLRNTGTADFIGFGFNWGGDPLTLDNFAVTEAWEAPGAPVPATDDTPALPGGATIDIDDPSFQTALFGLNEVDGDGNSLGQTNDCGTGCGFDGNLVNGENKTLFDYIYRIGRQGGGQEGGIDEVTFTIMAPGVTEPDLDPFNGNVNPFSNVAVRAQEYVFVNDENVVVGGNPEDGSDSIKLALGDPQYIIKGEDPNFVPEIDGPVLIQVGFALGGLYLLLLGRRREEDELAHAA